MKKTYIYTALAGLSLLFAGCNEDLVGDYVQPTEKHFGEEIVFGGSASYNVNGNGGTRTVYGGYKQGATEEPIYWVPTDEVRLYCPEASIKTADYAVTTTDADETQTGLNKKGDAGLQWGNPGSPHTFYGVYPIPADNSLQEGTVLNGTIPAIQNPVNAIDNNGVITFMPDMNYAYMVAKTEIKSPNAIGENVYLRFAPIATAVEIELKNDANLLDYYIREIHLSSDKHYLSGSFSVNLHDMTTSPEDGTVAYGTGCPPEIVYGEDVTKTVGIRLTQGTSVVVLEPEATIRFTIFMLPSTDGASDEDVIDDLKITLIGSSGQKEGTFTNIKIKKSKKNYIHKLPIDGPMSYVQSDWLQYVDGEKTLNTLSVPGAGGAVSGYEYNDANANYMEQTLEIDELWNTGIRCFEFTVDKDDAENGDISDNEIYCNSIQCGKTLGFAVGEVKRLLMAHPAEFAMVILTYQENEGWGHTRDAQAFQNQIDAFWKEVSGGKNSKTGEDITYDDTWINGTGTELFNPSMTLNEARGKLFCIARPTSEYEDNAPQVIKKDESFFHAGLNTHVEKVSYDNTKLNVITSHEDILVIKGWGAMKDKFERRGFTTCHFHRGTGHEDYKEFKNYISNAGVETAKTETGYVPGAPGRPFDVASTSAGINTIPTNYITNLLENNKLTADFEYDVVSSSGEASYTAWVQEWARVSNSETPIMRAGWENWSNTQYFLWANSYVEKQQRIRECLDMAINATEGRLYINSLCGYYINEEVANSFTPNALVEFSGRKGSGNDCWVLENLTGKSNVAGMSGNIAGFAKDVNSYFKGLLDGLLDSHGRLAGSTGIVLMDRVSNEGDGADIPSIIIANNFAADQNVLDPTIVTAGNLDDDDVLAGRKDDVNITWGEWE